MSTKTLSDLSKDMSDIDFAMLFTKSENGAMAGRPMSNNGDAEYDGDSYFFADEHTDMVAHIQRDASVSLSFAGSKGLLGKPGIFIAVEGRAALIKDRQALEAHWTKDIERYFPEGIDTPGLVLIKVHAERVQYWAGEDHGEITV